MGTGGEIVNIESVIHDNRCRSCGYCFSICPMNAIEMAYQEGFYRPEIKVNKCVQCGKCVKTCPAEHHCTGTGLIGSHKELLLAHSTNLNIRHNATSGGVINSLVRFLLQRNIVDGVLMSGYDPKSRIETSPQLITTKDIRNLEENTRDFASRYVLLPVLTGLQNIPKEIKKIAVVGTACQIQALKLGGGNADLDIFTIGITCSGGMSYKATEQYKKLQNMPKSKMFYRGDGWPGKNCLISDGKNKEFDHLGSLFERMFSSQIFKNPGCRECKDHFAEQAEISFCDFWNAEERRTESEGNSCVIVRSKRAEMYFNQMLEAGFVEEVRTLSETEIAETQMHVLKAKKGNLHNSVRYRIFIKIVDYVFKHNLYERFGIREYNLLCKFYQKLCASQKI